MMRQPSNFTSCIQLGPIGGAETSSGCIGRMKVGGGTREQGMPRWGARAGQRVKVNVGTIPPDATDVEFLGRQEGPWLFVRYGGIKGWSGRTFLMRDVPRGGPAD